MEKELDLSGVDDVLAEDSPKELDLSGVDDVLQAPSQPEELSFLDKPSPAGPSLRETGKNLIDFAHGATNLTVAPDVLSGVIGSSIEDHIRNTPFAESAMSKLGDIIANVTGNDEYSGSQYNPTEVEEKLLDPNQEGGAFKGDVVEPLIDRYRGYQRGTQAVLDQSKKDSPWIYGGGALGGMLTGGALATKALGLGAKAMGPKELFSEVAKNKGYGEAAMKLLGGTATTGNKIYDVAPAAANLYTKALPFTAAEGALTSKHDIIGENANLPGVGQDIKDSLLLGIPAAVGLSGLGVYGQAAKTKAALKKMEPEELISNTPYVDKIKKFYEYGKEGINPSGRKEALSGLSSNENRNAAKVFDQFDEIDSSIGADMRNSIVKADESFARTGKSIDLSEVKGELTGEMIELANKFPSVLRDSKATKSFKTILTGKGNFTPTETKELMNDVDSFIDMFKAAGTNATTAEGETLRQLYRFRGALDNTLKTQVPGYAVHAGRFADFRNVIEQVVAGSTPVDKSGIYYGKLKNKEGKLFSAIRELTNKSAINTETTAKTQTAFDEMMSKLTQFQTDELLRAQQGLISRPTLLKKSARDIGKEILDYSTDYAARMAQKNVRESEAVKTGITKEFFGKQILTGANLAGRGVRAVKKLGEGDLGAVVRDTKNFTARLGRMLNKADDNKLRGLADRFESTPGLANIGAQLRKALDTKNQDMKMRAIFVIQQNPGAKALIKDEDLNEEEQIP